MASAPVSLTDDYFRFVDASLAVLILSIVAMSWALRFSLGESLLFAAAVMLWCTDHLSGRSSRRLGVNQLQFGGLARLHHAAAAPARQRRVRSARQLRSQAARGGLKPTLGTIPILLLFSWMIDRRWRTLLIQGMGAIAGAGALTFAVGCQFLRQWWSAWSNWRSALPGLEQVSDVSVRVSNYSLTRVIGDVTGGLRISLLFS